MIMKATKVDAGSLLLIDQDTGRFSIKVTKGEGAETVKTGNLSSGKGIASSVAKSGQPYFAIDLDLDLQWKKEGAFPIQSILCVPWKVAEQPVGVMELTNKLGDEPFSKEDLDLFAALANQVAISIENARLYEDPEGYFSEYGGGPGGGNRKKRPLRGRAHPKGFGIQFGHRQIPFLVAIGGRRPAPGRHPS